MPRPPSSGSLQSESSAAPLSQRQLEARKRREEAELRLLIEQEADKSSVLSARVTNAEHRNQALAKELNDLMDQNESELAATGEEQRTWERRLAQVEAQITRKEVALLELENEYHRLRDQQAVSQLALIDWFVPRPPRRSHDGGEEDDLDEDAAFWTASSPRKKTPPAPTASNKRISNEGDRKRDEGGPPAGIGRSQALDQIRDDIDMFRLRYALSARTAAAAAKAELEAASNEAPTADEL